MIPGSTRRFGCSFALLAALPLLAGLDAPVRGGVLRVAQRAELKTFNPVTALDAPSREVLRRLHADLVTIDRFTQKTVPGLAESWTRSADGLRYELKLRKGLRFSDGAAFTADDVVFSWAVYLDDKVMSPQRSLLLIDGQPIRAVKKDAFEVEFILPKPYAAAERLFDSIAMLPRHKLEGAWKSGKLRDTWAVGVAAGEVVGMGPFRLKEYRPGDAVVLERNPYYWKHAANGERLPYLDGIEFKLLADAEVQLARFVAGDLDILNRLDMKSIRFLKSKGAVVDDLGPGLEYNFLCFNLSPSSPKLGWFQSLEFRSALSLVVGREDIARLVYDGKAAPIWGHVSPGNRLWYSTAVPHLARSIAGAKAKLAAAGFRWNDGAELLDSSGARVAFSILVSTSSPERMRMAALLQADFAQLGIAVTIAPLEFRSMLDRVLNSRQFDTVLLGLGGGDADPNPEMNVWLSSGAMHMWNPNQKQPATPWEAELDALMTKQMAAIDSKERRRLYDRVQGIVAAQSPMIFLVSPNVVVAQRGNVGNFRPAVLDHFTLWNADELFLRKGGPGRQ